MRNLPSSPVPVPRSRRGHAAVAEPAPRRLCGDADLSGDGGYIAAMTALMIIPLVMFVAFAVDLGAWYAQSSKLQRAADQAAMAGVVWLPSTGTASAEATASLQRNGYTSSNTTFSVGIPTNTNSATSYQVTVTQTAPRFFARAFGMGNFTLTRSAIAEFIKPIPLGAPGSLMGNSLNPVTNPSPPTCPQYQPSQTSPCGPQSMLWSAVNSPYNSFANGDPYTVKCARNGSSGSAANCDDGSQANGAKNTLYRKTGYDFAVDIPASEVGVTQKIWVYDGGQFQRTVGSGSSYDCNKNSAPFNVSAYNSMTTQHCQTGDGNSASPLELELWNNDGSDLTVLFQSTVPGCRLLIPSNASAATYKNKWAAVCTFTPTQQGIYPLRVRSSGIPGVADTGTGINGFALQATRSNNAATAAKLYALNDLSIWTNVPGSTAKFYLASIGPEHAGKKLQLDLYDPGDGSGSSAFTMQIKAPPGGAPSLPPGSGTTIPATNLASSCKYNSTASATKGPATPNTANNCTVTTKAANSNSGIYNNSWLRVEVQIDPNYNCGVPAGTTPTDCWWTIQYNFGATSGTLPNDRTVWSLNVTGDPVHLIQ